MTTMKHVSWYVTNVPPRTVLGVSAATGSQLHDMMNGGLTGVLASSNSII